MAGMAAVAQQLVLALADLPQHAAASGTVERHLRPKRFDGFQVAEDALGDILSNSVSVPGIDAATNFLTQ